MFDRILKKISSKSDDKSEANFGNKFGVKFREKSGKFLHFLEEKSTIIHKEVLAIRKKCENLCETNYNNGLYHIEKGNLSDAIFRFYFIKKFWPNYFDAYYQLAYCLVLNKKLIKAKRVLEELYQKNPNYDQKGKELLERINSNSIQLS